MPLASLHPEILAVAEDRRRAALAEARPAFQYAIV